MKYSRLHSKHLEGTWHTRVPDLDNCIKYISDISIGIIYPDDRLVVYITATKTFSSNPRTEFIVSKMIGD